MSALGIYPTNVALACSNIDLRYVKSKSRNHIKHRVKSMEMISASKTLACTIGANNISMFCESTCLFVEDIGLESPSQPWQ